jgi:hypothetical protein
MGDEVVTGYFKSFDRALCGHNDDCDRHERHEERHEHGRRHRRHRHDED